MSYEIFTRKVSRMGTPMLSFSKIGQLAFNQTAARILQKDAIEYILLMWDAENNKIAMKSTSNKKDARAYRIRYNEKSNGAGFSAKTFLNHIGFDYSERHAIAVELNPNREIFLEVQIPESSFKRKQQPKIVERVKAG